MNIKYIFNQFTVNITSPAGIYLFQFHNENTKIMSNICSKITIKATEQRKWCLSGVFNVTLDRFISLFWWFHCWLWAEMLATSQNACLFYLNNWKKDRNRFKILSLDSISTNFYKLKYLENKISVICKQPCQVMDIQLKGADNLALDLLLAKFPILYINVSISLIDGAVTFRNNTCDLHFGST